MESGGSEVKKDDRNGVVHYSEAQYSRVWHSMAHYTTEHNEKKIHYTLCLLSPLHFAHSPDINIPSTAFVNKVKILESYTKSDPIKTSA